MPDGESTPDPKALVMARLEAVVDRLCVATTMRYDHGACHQTLHAVRFAMQGREEYKQFPLGEGGEVHLDYGQAEALVQALLPLIDRAQREVRYWGEDEDDG